MKEVTPENTNCPNSLYMVIQHHLGDIAIHFFLFLFQIPGKISQSSQHIPHEKAMILAWLQRETLVN